MTQYYLKPTIQAEPMTWRWYAWPYLIAPHTAACNIVERNLKIMQSYVQNPMIHMQAVKDPKMIGGPFVDFEESRVEEIKDLIRQTRENCATLIELHSAFKGFDRILQQEAKGTSLEELYDRIPTILKGMVELIYDLNSHPSVRLMEPLLYKKYYSDQYQEIALSNVESDFRKFILSTPFLEEKDKVYLKVPFADQRIDALFRLKKEPSSLEDIEQIFDIPESKATLFKSFFTETPPILKPDSNYEGDGVRVRYMGHACVLVESQDTTILLDPAISYPIQNEVPRYAFDDLPDKIDYAVITHNHTDHLMFETLLQLRHKIRHIVFPGNNKVSLADPSIKLILENTGFPSLIELGEFQAHNFKDGSIMGLPFLGEHCDLGIHSKLSYCVNIRGKKLIFAADSNNLDTAMYDHIFGLTGPIDMLFLGLECEGAPLTWIYGPLLTKPISREADNSRRLSGSDANKAWAIVESLRCRHAYVYAMGQEPWLNYVMALNYDPNSIQMIESDKFVAKCQENAIESERLFGRKEWILA